MKVNLRSGDFESDRVPRFIYCSPGKIEWFTCAARAGALASFAFFIIDGFHFTLCLSRLRPPPPFVLDIGPWQRRARELNSYLRHRSPLEPLQKVITQTISEKTFLKSRTILRRCFVRGFRVGRTLAGREKMESAGEIGQTKRTRVECSAYSRKIRYKRCAILIYVRSLAHRISSGLLRYFSRFSSSVTPISHSLAVSRSVNHSARLISRVRDGTMTGKTFTF